MHGSNQGGWIWQPVANLLRAAGHQVYAHGYVLADQSGRHPPTEWARTRDADDEGVGVKEVRGTTPCTQKKILLALAQVSQGRAR